MSGAIRTIGSLGLSALFLFLAVRGIEWSEVGGALANARWVWLVPMILVPLLSLVVRAFRWGVFVRPLAAVPTGTLISATAIGFAANMVLPLRAGEVVRPWVLTRKTGIRFPAAFATVALERLFDLATLVLFFAAASLGLPLPEEWRASGRVLFATFAAFLVGVTIWVVAPGPVFRLTAWLARPLPDGPRERLLGIVGHFSDGLAGLGSLRAVGEAILWSLAAWLVLALAFGFGFFALGLDVPFFECALVVTAVVAIAVSVPGGPGFVGMFQAGCVVALGLYGVPRSIAFSYSILTHVAQFLATVAFGLYFFLREDLHIKDVAAATAAGTPEEDADAGALR